MIRITNIFMQDDHFRVIFDCNFDIRDLNLAPHVPKFYRDILTVWQELHSKNPSTDNDYQHEIIWNNRFVRIDGKPVFYLSWDRKGVFKIHHLSNENRNFLSRSEFQQKIWFVSGLSNL